jgi:hypothetical protein
MERLDRAGLEQAVRLVLTGPKRSSFSDFVLSAAKIELLAGDGRASEMIDLGHLSADLDRRRRRVSLKGELGWRGEAIDFRVKASAKPGGGDIAALGSFRLGLSGNGAAARELGAPFASLILGATHLSGEFDFSGQRLELRDTEFQSGLGRATGELAVSRTPNGPRIEGSLAVAELDLDRLWRDEAVDAKLLPTLFGADSVDLRLSADRTRWRGLTTGAAAFTLTGKAGRLASEIAHLDLLGGSLLGHVEAEFADGLTRARTRLTAQNLEVAQLTALGLSGGEWLTGFADLNLEAETEGRAPEQLRKNIRAKIRASLPEGGRMRFDPVKLAGSLSAQGLEGWDAVDLSWRDFADLRFEMTLSDEHLRFIELMLTTEAGAVKGRGEVDLGTRDLDWRLDVLPPASGAAARETEVPSDLGLSITGTLERPSIRPGRRSGRADGSGKLSAESPGPSGPL